MINLKRLTIREALNQTRIQHSDRPSLSFVGEQPVPYSHLAIAVRNISGILITLGIEKGDKVLLLGENSPNWGISYLAVTSIGAVAVPVLPDFSELEIEKIFLHSETKIVIASNKLFPKLSPKVRGNAEALMLLNNFSVVEKDYQSADGANGYSFPEPILNVDFCELEFPDPLEEDLAAIIYTSGTTGRPKGVMLSHKNLISNALSTLGIQNVTCTDRFVSILPLPHTYECTLGLIIPVMRGASVSYLSKPPTASVLIPAFKEIKPTMILSVPLIIEKIFKNKIQPELTASKFKRKLYSIPFTRKLMHKVAAKKLMATFGGELHFFGIGGSKLSYEVERFLYEGGFPYSIGYGMTEASPLIAGCEPKLVRFRSTGFSIPGQEIMIANPNAETGEGEIYVRGANVMMGYYKEPELTQEIITSDGWLKTGDLGYLDKNDFLEIRGRLKSMILGPSGENIYPEDIEDVINNHSMVLESLVYEMKGKLIAKVHFNYDAIESKYAEFKESAFNAQQKVQSKVTDIMEEVKHHVNSKVSGFSRIYAVVEQVEPFEKTPTHKIKRYIYTSIQNS